MAEKRPRRDLLERLMPERLSTRLISSMTVAAFVVFAVIATGIGLAIAYHVRALGTAEAVSQLAEGRLAIELRARELDSFIISFTEWQEFYGQTTDPDPAFISNELDPWLPDRANASTLVWTGPGGDAIHTYGDSADVKALLDLTRLGAAAGVVRLPSGPSVLAIRPVVGYPEKEPVGTLAITRPLADDPALMPLGPSDLDDGGDPSAPGRGWTTQQAPSGYASVVTDLRDGAIIARGSLTGIDGETVAVLEVSRPDPWLGEGRAWLVILVPVSLGLITTSAAFLLGTALSRSIERPLAQFVTYLRDQGYLALQGLRPDEELALDPNLPDHFIELGNVIIDLMTQLRVIQSDLIEAGDHALAAEHAFRTVVEESPEVKILVREGVVEIANPAAAHFFGLHLGDLVRAEPGGLFGGVDLFDESGDLIHLAEVRARAQYEPVVARCVVPNQPDRWVEISVAAIDPEGDDYVISARNITEERRLDALRQEILSLVSHDMRSPLTVVNGYLDILRRDLGETQREDAIGNAQRGIKRMEGLLDDLLGATRAERAFAPTVMRSTDFGELVSGIASSLGVSSEQDVAVTVDEGVMILGDPARLEQAAANLIGNAIKHGPPAGTVRVSVHARDGRAVLAVEDEGTGVPAEDRERVFERGVRGTSAEGTPGMGLGLYIVRAIAEAHSGTVSVGDADGGGARFVLDLPLEHAPED